MAFDPRRLVLDDLDEIDPIVDPPPPSKIKIKIKSGTSYVLPLMTIPHPSRTYSLTLPSDKMASPTVASSSKANAASSVTATSTANPVSGTAHSKRRLPNYDAQVNDEAHQSKKPRLEEAVYSSAKDGIEAAIKSAYGKVHADEVNHLKTQLRRKDTDVQTYKNLFTKEIEHWLAELSARRVLERQLQQKDTELETYKDLKRQIQQKDVELDACKGLKLQLQQKSDQLDGCKDLKRQLQQKEAKLDACKDQLQQKDADLKACKAKLVKEQDRTRRVMDICLSD